MTFLIRLRPNWPRWWWFWRAHDDPDDAGTTTVEYAVVTVAAAALATGLLVVFRGKTVLNGITSLVQRAISVKF
jgi:hypothetical protein